MYYLRKELYKGSEKIDDTAIFKHHDFSRYYRGDFKGIEEKYQGMKVYRCKTLKNILRLRETTFNYCGEYFDVYNEDGKVDIEEAA